MTREAFFPSTSIRTFCRKTHSSHSIRKASDNSSASARSADAAPTTSSRSASAASMAAIPIPSVSSAHAISTTYRAHRIGCRWRASPPRRRSWNSSITRDSPSRRYLSFSLVFPLVIAPDRQGHDHEDEKPPFLDVRGAAEESFDGAAEEVAEGGGGGRPDAAPQPPPGE